MKNVQFVQITRGIARNGLATGVIRNRHTVDSICEAAQTAGVRD